MSLAYFSHMQCKSSISAEEADVMYWTVRELNQWFNYFFFLSFQRRHWLGDKICFSQVYNIYRTLTYSVIWVPETEELDISGSSLRSTKVLCFYVLLKCISKFGDGIDFLSRHSETEIGFEINVSSRIEWIAWKFATHIPYLSKIYLRKPS